MDSTLEGLAKEIITNELFQEVRTGLKELSRDDEGPRGYQHWKTMVSLNPEGGGDGAVTENKEEQ